MNKPFSRVRQISEASYAEPIQIELVALEERIMFDGAAAAEVADAATDAVALEAAEAVDPKADADALVAAAGEMPQTARNEIFFVDAAIEDPAGLISELPSGAEVVLLDADQDGVAQMASVLEGRTDLDAIHILAHGEEGQLALGNSHLDAGSIVGTYNESLTVIGEALSSDGDILIYGCDFSSGEAGIEATAKLAEMTGADIAASDDLTGHADLGGDWVLETKVGQIETLEVVAEGWDGVLAPPEVTVPESALATSEDTDLVISDVSVADADGDNLDVSLDVSNGTITLAQTTNLTVSGDGTGSVTLSGSAADINNALSGMIYRADSNYNGSDTFTIAANDGSTTASESVGVQVTSVNDAPTLTPTNPSVDEGGTAQLTDANFGVDDPDLDMALNTIPQLAKQLVFKLDPGNLPDEGNLLLNGAPLLGGSTFSLQDVRDGNLTYRHGGADVSAGDTDNFAVTINDGGGSGDVGPTEITIDLLPVNQAPTIGGSPSVFEGQGTEDEFANPGTVTETADIGASLSISDRDDTPADSQITITNIDNAGEGTLFWDIDGDGQLDTGEALNGGETFAASELAAGRLRFAHDGDEVDSTNPSFDIEVTDGGGGAGSILTSGPQTIDIAVSPNDDNPELTTNAPVTVIAGISETVQIENLSLQASDDDTGNSSIVFVVTDVPTKGELRIDGEVLGVGGRFTQADIDAGRIDYNSTSAFVDGETDTFRFEVRDSTLRAFNDPGLEGADRDPDGTITDHTFTINLSGDRLTGTPPDGPASGRSGTVNVESSTIGSVTVTEADGAFGGVDTVTIISSELEINLQTVDSTGGTVPLAPEETVFRITAAPGNGTLWLAGAALGNYDSFTQADINNGDLQFSHDGSENHQDVFEFSVTGGTSADFDGTFTLDAIPTNDAPSVAASDLPLIPEGATIRVTSSYISLGDVDTNNEPGEGGGVNDPNGEAVDDDLMFRFTDLPDNGALERFNGSNWVAVTTDDLLPSDLLTTSADGEISGLRYTHDGSEIHNDSFSVQVRDDLTSPGPFDVLSETTEGPAAAGNLSGTGTVNVTLAGQNDAPISPENFSGSDSTITDEDGNSQTTANVPLYLPEGGNSVIDSSLLKSVDTDNTDPGTLQYRLTQAPAYGALTVSGNQLGVGSTFTQEDIDNGRLTYEHDGSENFADDFKFIVSDSVSDHVFSPGGVNGASTFNIVIDGARNDRPEIENSGASSIDLFGTFSHDFGTDLTIVDSDIDDGNVDGGAGESDFIQVTVTLKDSSGTNVDLSSSGGITLGSTTGLTQTDSDDNDGDLVFQGTIADVQAALTNLNVELQNQDHNDTFTLDVTVDDRLRDASGNLTGGANGDDNGTTNEDDTPINDSNNRDTVSVTFRASDDNDDPTTTSSPGNQTVNEDTVLDLSGYVIDDVDAFDGVLTVDLAVANGHLSVTGNATTSDPSSLTLTGTLSEINAALDQLTYIADQDFHSPDNTTDNPNDDTLTIRLNDGGGNGSGGGIDVLGTATDIAINPVNDAPTVGVPGTQTLASGVSITFSGALAPTVGDAADANNAPLNDIQRLTVSVPAGTGTLSGSGASGLTDLNVISGETLVFEGTLAQLNAELDGLTFTPTNPNFDGTVPITVEINDLANGGTALSNGVGGALTASDTFNVQISSVNDGPTVTPPADQNVDEDDSLTFSGVNAFTVTDPDDFGADMVTTVSVDHGVVIAAGGSGATLSGDGTSTLTITGTESEINAALDGIVYTPDADFHTAGVSGDTITVALNDQGNTGTGVALSDSQSADINVDPVNDRPTASGGPETVAVPGEDQTGTAVTLASLLSGNYDDATDNQMPTGGDTSTTLSFVAITGSTGYDLAQGTWRISDGSGGWIDVPASGLDANNALVVDASREIRFNPADDFHGTPGTLDVRLADGDTIDSISESTAVSDLKNLSTEGGTGETGRWSAGTVILETSVANENDRPSGSDATLTAIDEDNTTSSGETVGNLFSPVFKDATDDQTGITGGADASTPLGGIAIIGSAADAANEGTWQYSTDGGASWTDVAQGANDDTDAIVLPNNAQLRFVPVTDFNGTPGALGVRLADATQTFSASADISGVVGDDSSRDTDIWSAPVDLNTSITPRNDAPILGGTGTSATVDESTSPNAGTDPEQLVTGASVSDLDIGTTSALSQFGAGTITVSMDDGGQSFDQLTITNASLPGIASVSGGTDGSDLVVELESTATTAQVAAIVEALRYNSSSDTFDGTRDISITLSDGNNDNGSGNNAGGPDALTDTLSASIAITEQNDPPDASDNTVIAIEDTTYEFSAADFNYIQPGGETDVMDGVRIDTLPGIGTLELNGIAISAGDIIAQSDIVDGNLTYVPPADENGADFKSFTFSVRDDRGAFDTTLNTMTVNVLPVNDTPSASPSQDFTIGEDDGTQTVNSFMQSIDTGGGADEDSQTVTFNVKNVTDGALFTAAELFDVLPNFTDATDADNTLTFTASDILADGETETVTVTVGVTDNGGTANGGVDTGTDQTFTITIIGANDQPVLDTAQPDQSSTDGETITPVDVSGNFSDVDASDTLTFTATGLPPGLTIDPTTGVISGTIDNSASTTGAFTVIITADDGSGTATATQTDTFTWTVANLPPVAQNDTDTTDEDTAISRDAANGVILPNDSDTAPDNDTLSVDQVAGLPGNVGSAVPGSNGGQFTINADGSYDFDPAGDFEDLAIGESRTTSVGYQVTDGEGGTDTAVLTVTVTGVNDQPVLDTAQPDQSSTDGETITPVDVSGNFSDVDASDTLTFTATGLPPGLTIDPTTGVISGTIDNSASTTGAFTVIITADDGSGTATATQTDTFTWTVANLPPVAQNDTDTTDEDTAISRDAANGVILPNDSDTAPDNDTLSVDQVAGLPGNVGSAVPGSNGGQFTINADGSYDFDPAGDFEDLAIGESRTTSVGYQVTDGEGGTDTAVLTVTVTGVNDQPVLDTAQPDQSSTDGETITPVDVSGNFSDVDASDTLTFTATGLPPGLTIDPTTGVISGTIDNSASTTGAFTVIITADDGSGTATATQTDTFTWTVANLPPVAQNDTDTTDEDTAISRDAANGVILPNDSDTAPDNDTLSVDQVAGLPGNVGSAVPGSNGGQFTINADGSYDFDPAGDFEDLAIGESRTTSVGYQVTDGEGGTDTAVLTVTVTGVNDQPVLDTAQPDQSSTDGETITPVDVSGNFSDVDASDTLTFTATGLPPGLTIDPTTGVISGTIDNSASTTGAFTVIITADDGSGTATATQTDTFTWTVANLPPVAQNDTDTTDEDTAISRDAANGVILPNDSDTAPDNDTLSVDQVAGLPGNVGSAVPGSNGGQFTINADGSYDFDPAGDFEDLAIGESRTTSVGYQVTDGEGGTDTAVLTVTVTGVNDQPVLDTAQPDQSSTDGETITPVDVSGNFSDVDASDTLTFTATGLPPGLTIDPTTGVISGMIDFDASTGGPYSVTVTATDFDDDGNPTGTSVDASFTWTVTNPAPVAVDDTDTTDEDTAISRDAANGVITPNDRDTAPDNDTLSVDQVAGLPGNVGNAVTGSNGGQFTINADGSYDFDPDGDFDDLAVGESRTTEVSYRVSDGEGGTDTATLTVTVTGENDPPVANPDVVTTLEGAPVSGNLLTNDTDIDGGTLTVIAASVDTDGDGTPDALSLGVATVLTNAAGDPIGTLTLGTDGAFTFVPAAGYDGPVPQVTYTISDGNGGTARSTLDITLTPVEDTTNTDDVNRGVPFDPMDREERVRPRIAVDHIVVETANAANDLFGTPALLSDVYTSLGVRHPILTAINALQDLDGTAVLSTRGPEVFSGLVADGPVTQAVRSIGFDPIDDQYRLFNRDFSDGFQTDHADGFGEPAFGDTPSSLVTIQTRLGPIASFELAETAGSPEVLVSIAGAAGERLAILAVDAESLGDSRAVISDDGYSLRLCGLESGERIQFAVQLETGTWLAFELQHQDSDDRGERDTLVVTEQSAKTFTANTERLAYAGDIETAKLMQALR